MLLKTSEAWPGWGIWSWASVVCGEHRSQWPRAQGYSWAGILFLLCKKEPMILAT